MSIVTVRVREGKGDPLAFISARLSRMRSAFAVAHGGIRTDGGDFLGVFRVRVGQSHRRGGALVLVLVPSRIMEGRRKTGLGGRIRDRVNHRVDGGMLRYRRRRRWGQGRRGRGR